jgi:phosphatidylserine/phosphatidylglycerophosphate/cardiolipin synthase-like enzyme
MMTLSSTGEVLTALRRGADVSLVAYTLPPGRILDALDAAARRGAHVRVRLEGYVYKDDGAVGARNEVALAALRAAGADAQLVHPSAGGAEPVLHLKGLTVDGALFLDDRNWPDDGADTIIRDDFAGDAALVRDAAAGREDRATSSFSVRKRQSLALEARLIGEARAGDEVIVESESFGDRNPVYDALRVAAKRGAHVRVLVSARDASANAAEAGAIRKLHEAGAQIRVCDADEKFAVVNGARGWIGSANATAAFEHPDQLDWGARIDDGGVIAHVAHAFEERWARGDSTASLLPRRRF